MALDPRPRRPLRIPIGALVLTTLLVIATKPALASAALQSAAGGKPDAGGFAKFVHFVNQLADNAIPVGAAFSVLGLVWAGLLFQAGDSRAGRALGLVALGAGIVLLAKPIAA